MNSDFSPELQQELMDDFYAEADEYFTNIRQQLTHLESGLKGGNFDRSALESLFRSMHSLKGISAIVLLREVEQLAHAAEDFLRQLSKGQRELSEDGLQLLIDATGRLEQIVSAHRQKKPGLEIGSIVQEFARFSIEAGLPPGSPSRGHQPSLDDSAPLSAPPPMPSGAGATSSPTATVADVRSLRERGLIAARCVFSPSKTLDTRGVNVGSVRARLALLGEIVSAAPRIASGGSMTFEFIVGFREFPEDTEAFEADRIVVTRLEAESQPSIQSANVSPSSLAGSAALRTHTEDDHVSGFFIAPSHYVRVDLARLDELMRLTGDLVIQRSRLEERLLAAVGPAAKDRTGLQEVNQSFARTLRELRQAISSVRMVSVAEIFARMPFIVRDVARESGKQARLEVLGQQTEVDKFVVERLKEPLLHLVRNAVSHGIEIPAERVAKGKPAEGTVRLHAATEGDWVIIRIRDDGHGVDYRQVAERAAAQGLEVPKLLDRTAVLNLLCAPGFSTREQADLASGRGVGMAVVQNTVRQLAGSLSLDTEAGLWTEFTLRLPLTLSIMPAFVVGVAGQVCAIAQHSVEQILQSDSTEVQIIRKTEIVPYRTGLLPLVHLRQRFNHPAISRTILTIVVVNSERGSVGLVVDQVMSIREVVVRPMTDPLLQVSGISGATELGDGRPVLILDTTALTNGVVRPAEAARSVLARAPESVRV